ncbi:proton-conducting transporter membrane subunit [Campylobacter sp. 19-13652]|uniref:proton-conducting transporter transmembrane domain-containing protein n=1 Tax=Campylobacter sp. 19-13652 TaxID=2840180 RepID=UPI001C79617E|nr:proton-conducting transporter membrane subunit [Campylobacter sp. 19-13652]BCX78708.1 hydrogenase 4 subunit B [Campylobacter sp. 19-13652]
MISVYLLFLFSTLASIAMYSYPRTAIKVGFGLGALSSFYACCHFLGAIDETTSFALFGNFLFAPHFELTPLGQFFSFVVSFIALASSIYGLSYAEEYVKKANTAVFASLFNAFVLFMLLVISANDTFSFIVLWELMTIVSAFLILVNDGGDKTLKAVMIYLGIAQIGAFCILCGMLIINHYTGSSVFNQLSGTYMPLWASILCFVLFLIGFGSKAGMWPFHVWLPLAHPAAPSNVSSLMSGVMIKVAIFGLIKFALMLPLAPGFGIVLVLFGAASALFGVLYALTQHDYKALLAYHSVENIGIILLGIGSGLYGLATSNSLLAGLGLMAGLYHVLNHATFKGLLFLSAGSVLRATHTKDMQALGGLAKKMPYTAAFFFIGAMAITALPPLNGFVSEWFVYRSMLLGGMGDGVLARFIFGLGMVALALTGALAVMCFVKVYGVIFGGMPRDERINQNAKEAPKSMLAGMALLALGCVGFGLGAKSVVASILTPVSNLYGSTQNIQAISTPLIAIVLLSTLLMPFVILRVVKANRKKPREGDPWACGFKYSTRMQMTAAPFTGDLRKITNWILRADKKIETNGYFEPVRYKNHTKDIWWAWVYEPSIKFNKLIADKIGIMQNGKTNLYALYVLLYLCAILAIGHYML